MAERRDICVIGGAGHVGAPLGVVLASRGFRTLIYDINLSAVEMLRAGKMPFLEEGGDAMLREVLGRGTLEFSDRLADVAGIPYVILTIGTPIDEFHNPRFSLLTSVVDALIPHLEDTQSIILRSTVCPGATDFLHRYLREKGKQCPLAFCPERVVQGRAIREIQELPQLISGTSPQAVASARIVFERIAPELIELSPAEAEYAKLICNAYRYIQFAATNQLYMMAESAGIDYNRLLAKMRQGYPRMSSIPGPGFAAGPCLIKDTMQLFAFAKPNFILGQAAMTINESLPQFIVSQIEKVRDLKESAVGILGMAFKAESDDIRDALSFKLAKHLRFAGASVLCSDEFASDPTFLPKEELVRRADVVVIGVPHLAYQGLVFRRSQILINIWGIPVQIEK
jgi:UDP-N-acetyl-D-mannosaminuronic acid dehydrogenase